MAIVGLITNEGATNAQAAASNQGFQFTPINFSISDTAGSLVVTRDFASKNTTWYSAVISGFNIIDPNNVELNLTIPPAATATNKEIAEIYIEAEDLLMSPILLAIGQPESQLIYDISGATVLRVTLQITNLPISGIFTFQYTQAVEIQAHETSPTFHPLNKLDGTVDPTPTNDSSEGYSRNSVWINAIKNTFFICTNAAVGAAVWTSGASSGRRIPFSATGDGSQTLFTSGDLSPSGFNYTSGNGSLEIYLDGVHQSNSSFIEVSDTSFSLATAPALNVTIDVVVTDVIQVSNANTMLEFSATGDGVKTVFAAADFTPTDFSYSPDSGQIVVFVGNVYQSQSEYTQSDPTTIQFDTAPENGATIRVLVFSLVGIADAYRVEELDNIIIGNPIVNGSLEVWQEGTTRNAISSGDYLADQSLFLSDVSGFTINATREDFSLGQTDVEGSPRHYLRLDQTVTGTGGTFHDLVFVIEDVETFSGEICLISFYAKSDANAVLSTFVEQNFGTGGSPSATVSSNTVIINTQTGWNLHKAAIQLASVSGETLGSNNDDHLKLRIRLPLNAVQTIDIALPQLRVGRIHTPFEFITQDENLKKCLRYYEIVETLFSGDVTSSSNYHSQEKYLVEKINTPSLTFSDSGTQTNFPSGSETTETNDTKKFEISVTANASGAGRFARSVIANSRLV